MENIRKNKIATHASAIIVFLLISVIYFSPVLEGEKLNQHDVQMWKGMSKEVNDFHKETDEISFWTNSMFGGMPTYLINTPVARNVVTKIHSFIAKPGFRPISHLLLYFISFYVLLLVFGVNPWMSIVGAIAFGFSSYFLIIIEAGHITKAIAIGYMPLIIAGIFLTYKQKYLTGSLLLAFFLAFQILSNHIQIVYYTFLTGLIFAIAWFIKAIREKTVPAFFKSTGFAVIAVILALAINFPNLYLTYDYGKQSIRGESELSINKEIKTSGLDKDYATAWSYGVDETLTFLIPNFKGGASGAALGKDSETYKTLKKRNIQGASQIVEQLPMYWGPQPFTSGPVYIGAIIMFLFFLSLFWIKGPLKWWIVASTLLAIFLSWGKNMMWLTDFFMDYVPGYNKFRTVSMTLVIAELTIPLLAFVGLSRLLNGEIENHTFKKSMKYALGIAGGITLLFALFPGAFYSFEADQDQKLMASGWPQFLIDAIRQDRMNLLQGDAFRSLIFILLSAGLVFAIYKKRIKNLTFILLLGGLIIIDLWPVNKRYLNNDDFSRPQKETSFTPNQADQIILKDKDPNFRVLNLTSSTFNDGRTSYFHKSIGGYHGAKLRRYQELIDHHITSEMSQLRGILSQKSSRSLIDSALAQLDVLNMLNTKYIIVNPQSAPLQNRERYGNAWFVKEYKIVENADQEIAQIGNENLENTAVIDDRFADQVEDLTITFDSTANIRLLTYEPNYLKYESKAQNRQLAVFSEIYYPKGWTVKIDGEEADHFRVNYVLRGMTIPAGEHTIEFSYDSKMYHAGVIISWIAAIIMVLGIAGIVGFKLYKRKDKNSK